jgi:hypothetical protein
LIRYEKRCVWKKGWIDMNCVQEEKKKKEMSMLEVVLVSRVLIDEI